MYFRRRVEQTTRKRKVVEITRHFVVNAKKNLYFARGHFNE
jgi:hypothetical protein